MLHVVVAPRVLYSLLFISVLLFSIQLVCFIVSSLGYNLS